MNVDSGKLLPLATLVGLVAASTPAEAMRCGHRLIREGVRADELLRYCGQPLSVESRYAERPYGFTRGGVYLPGFFEEVRIEEWTYNFGPRRFMRVVTLENGVVSDVRELGYGFLEE
jgi:Protein of unknown function (DUF2845)